MTQPDRPGDASGNRPGDRLLHPSDLAAWSRWQVAQQGPARRLRSQLRGGVAEEMVLSAPPGRLDVVVSLRSMNASSLAALVEPIAHFGSVSASVSASASASRSVGIVSDTDRTALLGDGAVASPTSRRALADRLDGQSAVIVPSGVGSTHELALAVARELGARVFVVQHGLLTPFVPPLPPDVTLLAWSAADGEFWRSGRDDIEVIPIGSQLLWQAARQVHRSIDAATPPTFLGQLHAAELPRADLTRVSYRFCRDENAAYRPHPAESDRVSEWTHTMWRRRGIAFADTAVPLDQVASPIVAVFSTGVLEAAAAGRPAWVHHPDPPRWLSSMWDRYGLNRWGDEPTPIPVQPAEEPAARVARMVTSQPGT